MANVQRSKAWPLDLLVGMGVVQPTKSYMLLARSWTTQ
jgi:hypothetical protein